MVDEHAARSLAKSFYMTKTPDEGASFEIRAVKVVAVAALLTR